MTIANPHFIEGAIDAATLRLKRHAALASISVGAVLIAIKVYAYLATKSVSLLSSLMDSCFDTLASLITFMSVLHAATPADAQHRFGHGKMEALSALAQAVFVTLTACFLLYEAASRLINPVAIETPVTGIVVTLVSIVLTIGLVLFQRHVIKRTQSIAITADHLHYKGDLLMNMGVIAALLITGYTGIAAVDALFALGIALHLLWGVWGIERQSVDILMDKELPPATRKDILALINRHPKAVDVHDLRTRNTGERIFIEFHLELDGNMSLKAAHQVTEEIEKILFDAYPASEVIIHQEPAGLDDHRIDDQVRHAGEQQQAAP